MTKTFLMLHGRLVLPHLASPYKGEGKNAGRARLSRKRRENYIQKVDGLEREE